MPGKQGLCWCFGGRPPEIRYGIDNGAPLKSMAAQLPMPSDESEVDAKFADIVAELDLDNSHREAMFKLTTEKKWQIYCSKIQDRENTSADNYVEKIRTLSTVYVPYSTDEEDERLKHMNMLKTALRTQPMSFVTKFIEVDGLQTILDFLEKMDYETCQGTVHTSAIGCIKALMNNSQGRAHVLAHPNCINIIAQSLSSETIRTKVAALEILGAVCLVPGGHKKVLEAMLHFQKYAAERTRFQTIINDLDRSTGLYRDEVSLKTSIMIFINAVLRCGPGKEHLEFRLHLRYEFLMLGIQPIIEKLHKHENATLDTHLDFFEMMRSEDEKLLFKKFENATVDTKSAYAMFDTLRKKLTMTTAYQNFMSILQHFLLFPFGNDASIVGMWQIIDRVVQQVAIQQKNGQDPDGAPVEMNVKQMIRQMSSDNDIKTWQQKLRDMEKQTDDVQNRLSKKEHECEVIAEEKDELASTVTRMKTKLEKETQAQAELKQTIAECNAQIEALKSQLMTERGERQKLTHLVKTGSLPDDAKVGLSTAAIIDINSSMPQISVRGSVPAAPPSGPPPPAPPPPPSAPGAPPPPPPGGPSASMQTGPRPKNPMKSFNWTKLPDAKISGTIWTQLDTKKIYRILDLEEFERRFSAYQRKQTEDGGDDSSLGTSRAKARELSVIDGRRAQNFTILLSKLKLTNEEVVKAILTVDKQEDLPKDMVEQLLKFVPTSEEIQLLAEHAKEIDQMARADRFLYEASRILHYEQRLNALYFKKKFQERMGDIRPKMDAVLKASQELPKNKNFRQLLQIVLAFGNFMNRGQRGNARAFKLDSLNNMLDTKSSINRNITLLHYLVEILEKQFPDILKLEEELRDVRLASKVNLPELDKDITVIKTGLEEIQKELTFFREQNITNRNDRFVNVMNDFMAVASYNFSEVEETRDDVLEKFHRMLKQFSEENFENKPDEFFNIVDNFLTSLMDAKAENEKIKRQKEEDEKRALLEEQIKKERERIRSKRLDSPVRTGSHVEANKPHKGEFDELISALRTGDVYGDDFKKRRIRKKQTPNEDTRERTGPIVS